MVEGPTVRGCALGGAYTFDLCDTVVSDDNTEYVASTCTLVIRPSVTDMTRSAHTPMRLAVRSPQLIGGQVYHAPEQWSSSV